MTSSEANFTFPASIYYQRSNDFKKRVEGFVDEMENNFFRVIQSKASSLDFSDRAYILDPSDQGLKKMKDLKDKYLKKLHDMQNESSQNPMYPLTQCDEKYSKTFERYLEGKNTQVINRQVEALETKVGDAVLEQYQNLSKEELETNHSDMAEILKTVFGNDWYARFTQVAGVADFINNYSEKVDAFAKHHPKKAAILLKAMEQSDEFTHFLRSTEKLSNKLKSMPYMGSAINKVGKVSKWAERLKQLGLGRYLGFAEKFLGAGVKAGWVGTGVSVGLSAYYNVKNEEVSNNFKEGKAIRGSTKVVVGTAIDTVQKFGVVDGLVGGFLVGGPKIAILGGGLGLLNKAAQFIAPNSYKKLKSLSFKGIDVTFDFGTKTWKNVKSTASNAWSGARLIRKSIGKSLYRDYKNVMITKKIAASKINSYKKTVGIGFKAVSKVVKADVNKAVSKVKSKGESIGKAVKGGLNSLKRGIASFIG
ncbi:hypothetical protein KM914_00730 [Virgibacillus pantothenticus]|uniref:hypothetical protein n=1 Tax=Virgibacillus pantothenticus TaxID=1473 RepID=UPI001C236653|nr:hypothetical protein [Virgibacillus pantothenticus]MBU8564975.1 hypothetical protein [Virgibacillus pantothenticus]MBU8599283.1 hypothetical protein [Virgibacillus pantothenticus]MBU8633314.1 hypothetical protein [Virgibacillus pantothenticus]MBU8641025.1 hypothetical protein [Virgibacillus pantothenticus]MBU8645046.1 hypothetical protein [Virgibacillus pantothenticus]